MTTTILSPNKTTGRIRPIRVVVIHTAESSETSGAAEAIGNYFAKPSTQASAHMVVDTNSDVRCVPDDSTAWAAPGANADGLQLELAGRAGQTTGAWGDVASNAILERAARVTATWCETYMIPVRRLTNAQLGDGKTRGIVGHDQVSQVFRQSDHWDPGPAFPWARFLARVKALTGTTPNLPPPVKPEPSQEELMADLVLTNPLTKEKAGIETATNSVWFYSVASYGLLKELAAKSGVDVDEAQIARDVIASLTAPLTAAVTAAVSVGGSPDVIAEAVVRRLSDALAVP